MHSQPPFILCRVLSLSSMGNSSALSLPILCFSLLLFLHSGGILKLAYGQAEGAWCVAKPSSSNEVLQENINYACGSVDCKTIVTGGSCFSPETLVNHASVAMNLYFQKEGRHFWNCNFKNSGVITVTDPSYDDCNYAYA
ncbi:glucan endo-1,3-beta-glucosidase-like [Camellia sinensis]|nr:glucan endo-1,3-beta-glucosidase-like [Camellia sinensis]